MVIFLHGADTYRSRQRLHALIAGFEKKYDPYRTNAVRIDGTKANAGAFRSAVNVTGFLSSKRLVVVENVLTKAGSEETRSAVVEMIPRLDEREDVIVIFWEGDLAKSETKRRAKKKTTKKPVAEKPSKKSLKTILDALEHVEQFDPLTGVQLAQWIREEARRAGSAIRQDAVEELVGRVGPDLWLMSTTIAKLASWKSAVGITAQDVRSSVGLSLDENIFHLTDVLAERNLGETLRLLEEQIAAGAHALYILTMLVRQFRLLIQVRDIMEAEPNPSTIAQRLKLHPFIARRMLDQAKRFRMDELIGAFDRLLEMERQFKTSSVDPRTLFGLFAADLTIPGKLSQRVKAPHQT